MLSLLVLIISVHLDNLIELYGIWCDTLTWVSVIMLFITLRNLAFLGGSLLIDYHRRWPYFLYMMIFVLLI